MHLFTNYSETTERKAKSQTWRIANVNETVCFSRRKITKARESKTMVPQSLLVKQCSFHSSLQYSNYEKLRLMVS